MSAENSERPSEEHIQLFKEKWQNEQVKPFKGQDFYELKQKLLIAGELFEDPEFPCDDSVLRYRFDTKSNADRDDGSKVKSFKWRRPSKIARRPKFIIDGLTKSDVNQGLLGDCWFLAGIGSLADKEKFLNRVVCVDNTFDEGSYAGIFHFRFWDFGEWVDVVIDDRLPVDDDNDLVYLSSKNKSEFWTALLEKAYAKFKGNYKEIHGGLIEIAFQDFSGGILETHSLTETADRAVQFFKTKLKKSAMIGATILSGRSTDEYDLPSGHAYTITGAAKYGSNSLVRVRNPWGNDTEWTGPWSDFSDEWNDVKEEFKKEIKFDKKYDGEFWMSYKDFLKNFSQIIICNLSPHENAAEEATKKWEKIQFKGEWVEGVTAGGSSDYEETYHFNPQYMLTIDETEDDDEDGLTSVVIAVLQRGIIDDLQDFKFDVYKVEERDYEIRPMKKGFFDNKSPIKESEYAPAQEAHARLELLPGKYLIVPSTRKPDKEGEFLIRVFADNKFKFEQYDKKVEKTEEKAEDDVTKSAIELLFDEHAADEKITWKQLKNILDNFLGGDVSSKQLSRSIIAMVSKNYYRSIDLEKFKNLMDDLGKWKATFKAELDEDEESLKAQKLRDILRSLGLNVDTIILNSLVFTYASDKVLTLDDFLMCVVKAKTLIDHFSDDEIKASDRWTMRTLL